MFRGNQKEASRRVLKIGACIVVAFIVVVGALRFRGETIAAGSYSESYGKIEVREIAVRPLSLGGFLGMGDKFYRCEYSHSPDAPLESAISIRDDSYEPQKVEIVWESVREATVSFDNLFFFKLENGVWRRLQQSSSKRESMR